MSGYSLGVADDPHGFEVMIEVKNVQIASSGLDLETACAAGRGVCDNLQENRVVAVGTRFELNTCYIEEVSAGGSDEGAWEGGRGGVDTTVLGEEVGGTGPCCDRGVF